MGNTLAQEESNASSNHSTPRHYKDRSSEEWNALCREQQSIASTLDHATSLKTSNRSKNRYAGVLAIESTRVILPPPKTNAEQHNDYINANFVSDCCDPPFPQAYICAQAPLPNTIHDFWRMVWHNRVQIVVMLTRLNEGGKIKAHRYWPAKDPKIFKSAFFSPIKIEVQSIRTSKNGEYKMKKLVMHFEGKRRSVIQFHYTSWPDHSVPQHPRALLEMMCTIDSVVNHLNEAKTDTKRPMLVHCSAGIGRSGTFILIHSLLKQLKNKKESGVTEVESIFLRPIVSNLRKQRSGMITQKSQFEFCYAAIEYFLKTPVEPSELLNAITNHKGHKNGRKRALEGVRRHKRVNSFSHAIPASREKEKIQRRKTGQKKGHSSGKLRNHQVNNDGRSRRKLTQSSKNNSTLSN